MRSLVLDTSNKYLVVAIYENDSLVEAILEEGSKRQSENAIPYIEKLLDKHQLEMFDFDRIIVTCGPGSYTGVRVGLTIAKTVKTVNDSIQVKMVSSLASYAGITGKKISVIDARSKKVFVGVYDNGKPLMNEQMIDIDKFNEFYKDYEGFEVVGDGSLVGFEETKIKLHDAIYEVSKTISPVGSMHELIPTYIKDVEAKKIWQPSND